MPKYKECGRREDGSRIIYVMEDGKAPCIIIWAFLPPPPLPKGGPPLRPPYKSLVH